MKEYLFVIAVMLFGGFMGYQMRNNTKLVHIPLEERASDFVRGSIPINMWPYEFKIKEVSVSYWIAEGEGITTEGNNPYEATYNWINKFLKQSDSLTKK